MRSSIVGAAVLFGVAGGVFGTLWQGSLSRPELAPLTTWAFSLQHLTEDDDFRTVLPAPEEPQRLPLIRFDEPPLSEKIVQASFVSQPTETTELAPPPRRINPRGGMPLQTADDAF